MVEAPIELVIGHLIVLEECLLEQESNLVVIRLFVKLQLIGILQGRGRQRAERSRKRRAEV